MEASILFDTHPPGVGEDFFGKVPTPVGEKFPNSPPQGRFYGILWYVIYHYLDILAHTEKN